MVTVHFAAVPVVHVVCGWIGAGHRSLTVHAEVSIAALVGMAKVSHQTKGPVSGVHGFHVSGFSGFT